MHYACDHTHGYAQTYANAHLHVNMQMYFETHPYMLIGKILALANLAPTCESEMTSSLGLILYNAWKFANFCTGTENPCACIQLCIEQAVCCK